MLITYLKTINCNDENIYDRLRHDLEIDFDFVESLNQLILKLNESHFNSNAIAIDLESYFDQSIELIDLILSIRTWFDCTCRQSCVCSTIPIIGFINDSVDPHIIKDSLRIVDAIIFKPNNDQEYAIIFECFDAIKHGNYTLHPDILHKIKQNRTHDNIRLTPRQHQVYQLITERGASNQYIAKLLDISESTVKLHVSAIFKKYCVHNRTQLTAFAKHPTTKV